MTCSLCPGVALYLEGRQGFCKTHRPEAIQAARTRHSRYVRESELKHQAITKDADRLQQVIDRRRARAHGSRPGAP